MEKLDNEQNSIEKTPEGFIADIVSRVFPGRGARVDKRGAGEDLERITGQTGELEYLNLSGGLRKVLRETRGGQAEIFYAMPVEIRDRMPSITILKALPGRDWATIVSEVSVLAALRHIPFCPRFYGVQVGAGGGFYLEMEYAGHSNLRDYLSNQEGLNVLAKDGFKNAYRVIDGTVFTLWVAHSYLGFSHGDLKPDQIVIDTDHWFEGGFFTPVLVDYSLAKGYSLPRGFGSDPEMLGTPGYEAPERYAIGEEMAKAGFSPGQPVCLPISDMPAFGKIIYEIWGGKLASASPFETPDVQCPDLANLPREIQEAVRGCLRVKIGGDDGRWKISRLAKFLTSEPSLRGMFPWTERLLGEVAK